MDFHWLLVGIVGLLVVFLFFWFIIRRKQQFDAPLLGLLSVGLVFLGVAILQPPSIKYAGIELNDLKRKAAEINKQAEDATKLALETTALLTWNQGRLGGGPRGQEEIATGILKELYGDKALAYRHALQHKGFYATPAEELKKVPNVGIPVGLESPLYERFLKNTTPRKKR